MNVVDALEPLIRNYRQMATQAVKIGVGKLLIPANAEFDFYSLDQILDGSVNLQSQGNDGTEPSYLRLAEANSGRNPDGTEHARYIVVDVIRRQVEDIIDRDGNSLRPKVRHISGHGKEWDLCTEIDLLAQEMGNYVIMLGRSIIAAIQCRCPCLDADVFSSKEGADEGVAELSNRNPGDDYQVEKITPEFLKKYKQVREYE